MTDFFIAVFGIAVFIYFLIHYEMYRDGDITPPAPYWFSEDPEEEMMAQVMTMEMMDDSFDDPLF